MSAEDAQQLELSLRTLAALLGAAAVCLFAWRARLGAAVGTPRVVVRPARPARRVYLAAVVGLAVWLLVSDAGVPVAPSLVVLGLGVALVLIAPGAQDSVLGSSGVQYGWHARRFEQLEEWRLTGDHLRWRLFDEWIAAHAPAELHAELRTQLTAANAERESRFQR